MNVEKNKTIYMGDLPDNWEGLGNPKNITFSVTEDCNLACKYCYMTGKNHTKRMSFETAKKAVDYFLANRDIFDNKSVIWEFIGGEPFLEIDLIDKLTDYIKQQMFYLIIHGLTAIVYPFQPTAYYTILQKYSIILKKPQASFYWY